MTASKPARYLRYALAALAALFFLLLLFVNSSLADLAELIHPGAALWTHAGLLGLEALALFWFWKGLFRSQSHLLLAGDDSPEGRRAFAEELLRRMKNNPHILKAELCPSGPFGERAGERPAPAAASAAAPDADPEAKPVAMADEAYLRRCLEILNAMADEEIRSNARRIFLATALSQNGRLDALIMFVSLCRLVWRVSCLYNQRPHPREVAALYWAVITSVFLSLSIEELDIATEITVGFGEAFHAMAPAGMTASIPFAGKALQTFTAAAIDGAANCYLALRAGIITRNAYAYAIDPGERPGRAAVFKEAGAVLLSMSHEVVDKLAAALAASLGDAARGAGAKTAQAGKNMAGAVGSGAASLAASLGDAARGAGVKSARAGKDMAGAVGAGVERLAGGAARAGKGAALAARGAGALLLGAGNRTGGALKKAASGASAPARRVLGALFSKRRK